MMPATTFEITLFRASDDDYVAQGYSFAEELWMAQTYLDNKAFGGRHLWKTKAKGKTAQILDLTTSDPWQVLSDITGQSIKPEHGAGLVCQVLQLYSGLLDMVSRAGFQWVRYHDSFPEGGITWTVCSDEAADDLVLKKVKGA
jgi:hypothetical protein